MKTKPTHSQKLFAILATGRKPLTKELVRRVGHAFGGAVWRLRKDGHDIRSEPHPTKPRQWRYWLEKPGH